MDNLNSKIFGWCSYFNKVVFKENFFQIRLLNVDLASKIRM
ncbi:hypothetical protein [Orientia tsutsugamushi]